MATAIREQSKETGEREARALALLQYHETRQALAELDQEARQMADTFEALARLLREDPSGIDNPEFDLPTSGQVFELAAKVSKAIGDLAKQRGSLQDLGLEV